MLLCDRNKLLLCTYLYFWLAGPYLYFWLPACITYLLYLNFWLPAWIFGWSLLCTYFYYLYVLTTTLSLLLVLPTCIFGCLSLLLLCPYLYYLYVLNTILSLLLVLPTCIFGCLSLLLLCPYLYQCQFLLCRLVVVKYLLDQISYSTKLLHSTGEYLFLHIWGLFLRLWICSEKFIR